MTSTKTKSSLRDVLARNVRMLRARAQLSQEGLAELVELHRTYIGSIERAERNVSLDNIERLAKAFEITPSELLSDDWGKLGR